jgi:subtilisin family serine protease
MKRRSSVLFAVAAGVTLGACADVGQEPPAVSPTLRPVFSAGPNKIDGNYIVVLNEGVDRDQVLAETGIKAKYVYDVVVNGFAAELRPRQLDELRSNPDVSFIEEDQEVVLDATQTVTGGGGLWGIDRIDQRNLPFSGTYTYTATGAGVRVYVIDTGILTSHSQFGTRASNVYDAFGGSGTDCHGHGTHVAGTISGSTYGVAKGALPRGVRVLNCSGSGSTSGIIAGIDWVRVNRINPAVANLSLGGGFSSALNTAVTNLSNSGVFVAVAAGNSNANACNSSPSSASAVFTVASSTKTDAKSSFSNWGSCVDAYAPGSSVLSAWIGSNSASNTISGTSMASPHVAGVAALYKAAFGNVSSSTIDAFLKNNATLNVITGNVSGTPNRLLFKSTL